MSAIEHIFQSFGKPSTYDQYAQMQTLPQIISMAKGDLENARVFYLYGRDTTISSSPVRHDVWPGGAAASPYTSHKFYWPTAASELKVVSTSALDVYQGPSGAWTLFINGLDENWKFQTEVIKLNGTTPVISVKKFIRINECYITSCAGMVDIDSVGQAGNILVIHNDADKLMDFLLRSTTQPNPNNSQSARISIPDGWIGFAVHISLSVDASKEVTFTLNQNNNQGNFLEDGTPIPNFTRMRRSIAYVDKVGQPQDYDLAEHPLPIAPKHDLWLSSSTTTPAAAVSSIGIFLLLKL